jgi:hypothetical protein
VLRLWPKRLTAIVAPDMCRLFGTGGREAGRSTPASAPVFEVMDGLHQVLDAGALRRRAQIDLIVSDGIARSIPLPWQDNLRSDEQYEAYARACFDQAGFALEGEWIVQAAYRHFRGVGFGYALPRPLVIDVRNRLLERDIRLRSIMPMSAHAYWRNACGARGTRSILVLREWGRLSALLFDGKACAGVHVQPMGTGLADAARRLSNGIDAVFPSVSRVQFWATDTDDMETDVIKSRFPSSSFNVLPGLAWD